MHCTCTCVSGHDTRKVDVAMVKFEAAQDGEKVFKLHLHICCYAWRVVVDIAAARRLSRCTMFYTCKASQKLSCHDI